MTEEERKEKKRQTARDYYNARKNDPEFLAMRAERARKFRQENEETDRLKEQRKVWTKTYFNKVRHSPEWKAKHSAQMKKYREKKKNEQTTTTDSVDTGTTEL